MLIIQKIFIFPARNKRNAFYTGDIPQNHIKKTHCQPSQYRVNYKLLKI